MTEQVPRVGGVAPFAESGQRVLVVGTGVIGSQVFSLLTNRLNSVASICLVGRDPVRLRRAYNLGRLSAMQRGIVPDTVSVVSDVYDTAGFAEVVESFSPDVVVLAISRQSWWYVETLPSRLSQSLRRAEYGPWLPMHLSPIAAAMRAITESRSEAIVVNVGFPDAVGPALVAMGYRCPIGAGNVANNVPALRVAAAQMIGVDVRSVGVRLACHHYVAHLLRFGDVSSLPYVFDVLVDGDVLASPPSLAELVEPLSGSLERTPGVPGQLNVAASVVGVVEALVLPSAEFHSAGANGLVGGFPMTWSGRDLIPAYASESRLAAAIEANLAGQSLDGIAAIDQSNGIVLFEDWSAAAMRSVLGEFPEQFSLSDVDLVANDISQRMQKIH